MIVYDFTKDFSEAPKRSHKIDRVTIHSLQGNRTSLQDIRDFFRRRIDSGHYSSVNYAISYDGEVGMYVDEKHRAWTSSNAGNDDRALTIECATEAKSPYFLYVDTYRSLTNLLYEIAIAHGAKSYWIMSQEDAKKNVVHEDQLGVSLHRYFADTDCPGEYIMQHLSEIVDAVNVRLRTIYRVQVGAYTVYKNAKKKLEKVKAAGFSDAYINES